MTALMTSPDERFMRRALVLAAAGRGAVEPNPMVGAVIVRDGEVLGEGCHRRFGGPHAEIEALRSATAAGRNVRGATMYVTLEPCCHHGKTPPCAQALIEAGISRVVAAMQDPDEHVAARGFAMLREAGVEVEVGVCGREARRLLRAYIKLRTTGRCWVICKWAQTADGYLALPKGEGRWVSSAEARADVHRLRGRCDGICVGIEPVLADDPFLTNRSGVGGQPARVVLDTHLRIPLSCRLMRTMDTAPVIVAASKASSRAHPGRLEALRAAGAQVELLPADERGVDLAALLDALGKRRWTYLLVEGGAKVLGSFVAADLADELRVYVSPARVGCGAGALARFDVADLAERLGGEPDERRRVGTDTMLKYILKEY